MVTPVHNKADLLITPRKGGEPDNTAAKRSAEARTQPESPDDAPEVNEGAARNRAQLKQAVAIVNEALRAVDTRVNLQIDQESEQVVVKVVKESGEVIRQFPPKEVLELAKYLSEEGTFPPDKGVLFEGRI